MLFAKNDATISMTTELYLIWFVFDAESSFNVRSNVHILLDDLHTNVWDDVLFNNCETDAADEHLFVLIKLLKDELLFQSAVIIRDDACPMKAEAEFI